MSAVSLSSAVKVLVLSAALTVCSSLAFAADPFSDALHEEKTYPSSFHVCVVRDAYLHKTIADYVTWIPPSLAKSINAHFSWDAKRADLESQDAGDAKWMNWYGLKPFCSDLPIRNEEMALSYDRLKTTVTLTLSGHAPRVVSVPAGDGFLIHAFSIQFSGDPF